MNTKMDTILKSTLIICFLLLSSLAHAAGNTYYVTQNGNGVKDGNSLANAWSASQFNSLTGTGFAGNTFTFSGTFTTQIRPQLSGNSSNQVILDGWTGGTCTPLSSECTSSAVLSEGVEITGRYLVIQDFRMTNSSGNNIARVYQTNHILFRRNYLYNSYDRNYYIYASDYIITEENKITNFGVGSDAACGFTLTNSEHLLIKNNIIGQDVAEVAEVTQSANTIESHGSSYVLSENNIIYLKEDQPQTGSCFSLKEGGDQEQQIWRFNIFRDNPVGSGVNMGGQSADNLHHIYIYGNYIYNTNTGIAPKDKISHVYIWSNIINTAKRHGFLTWGGRPSTGSPSNIYFYNNTVTRCGDEQSDLTRGGNVITDGSNIFVKNNIYYNNRQSGKSSWYHQIYDSQNSTYDYNTYYHSSGNANTNYWHYGGWKSLTQMQAAGQEDDHPAGEVSTAPGFNDPNGPDNVFGNADDDYTLDGTHINNGQDLSECFYVNLSGGDSWFETNSGYSTVQVCFDEALDPSGTDWTTTPPTVVTLKRDTYGWSRGAYVYREGSQVTQPSPPGKPTNLRIMN